MKVIAVFHFPNQQLQVKVLSSLSLTEEKANILVIDYKEYEQSKEMAQ